MSDLSNREDTFKKLEVSLGEFDDSICFGENRLRTPPTDHSKWTGTVVDNSDPLRLGRVRVRIYGLYDDVQDGALPWALSEDTWLGSNASNIVIPEKGTVVRGIFEDGDIYKPVYNSRIANLDASTENESAAETIRDSVLSDPDYPYQMLLLSTDQGESITLNRNDGLLSIRHRSGLIIQIGSNGTINISQNYNSSDDRSEMPDMNVSIQGKINIESEDDMTIQSSKNVYISSVEGEVHLGKNTSKNLVCAHPICFVTGAPTNGGNTTVKA